MIEVSLITEYINMHIYIAKKIYVLLKTNISVFEIKYSSHIKNIFLYTEIFLKG